MHDLGERCVPGLPEGMAASAGYTVSMHAMARFALALFVAFKGNPAVRTYR